MRAPMELIGSGIVEREEHRRHEVAPHLNVDDSGGQSPSSGPDSGLPRPSCHALMCGGTLGPNSSGFSDPDTASMAVADRLRFQPAHGNVLQKLVRRIESSLPVSLAALDI